ncbi:Tripartite tricarboxylate transporter TctB family protein [Succinivibrio dextrinosolvens]|uniref:tripartite tricarboxylate transporter TctB family protein n=1 Tax=Succinivibrio dextrinosolvens TaxID=83771 RepID=UPI0008F18AA3|nr:tripartite tricarboxylate transporter TctB family protein [Succinivibrio dextrinosolvens]SFS72324.1 Tripartite tricarboxylate transporter TctB family protein [Succinivibrio dextrinosolvens]
MKGNGDAIIGGLFVLAGLAFLVPAIGYGLLPPPGLFGLGAGFFPTVTSAFVIFFGLWIVYDAISKGSSIYFQGEEDLKRKGKIMAFMFAVFVSFLALWVIVDRFMESSMGFFVGCSAMLLTFNHIFGRTLKFNIIFTAIFIGLLYGIFYKLLYIQFTL